MNLLCEGQGAPTVLLESGAGGSTLEWHRVQPAIAKLTQVCAYDRAGMGFSDAGPLPRTASAVVADLQALLKAARIRPPYVMVAHSLGSYYARLYTDRHISEVVGMVLVDPSVEDQDRRFSAVSAEFAGLLQKDRATALECLRLAQQGKLTSDLHVFKECSYGYSRDPAFSDALYEVQIERRLSVTFRETLLSETDQMEADSRELVAAHRSYGEMPLIVLTQSPESADAYPGLTAAQVEAMNNLWMQMHDELARLSTRGVNQRVEHSGHYIQKDRPDAVAEAIRRVLADSRTASR
jgi:pimeloyl-ACP methyl ester carboxylesterase